MLPLTSYMLLQVGGVYKSRSQEVDGGHSMPPGGTRENWRLLECSGGRRTWEEVFQTVPWRWEEIRTGEDGRRGTFVWTAVLESESVVGTARDRDDVAAELGMEYLLIHCFSPRQGRAF